MGANLGAMLVASVLAACAGVGQGPSPEPAQLRLHTLSAGEIAGTNAQTAYDAVQRLRPEFLHWTRGSVSAGAGLAIFIDENRASSADELRAIPAESVREIRFLDASEATFRYGSGYPAGALVVVTGASPPSSR